MDNQWMKIAYKEALKGMAKDEVPIGACIVKDGVLISKAHNTRQNKMIATGHAELIAIEKACKKLGDWRLEDCDLYVTLEPCMMCTGTIVNARIRKVYYGAQEKRWLGISSLINEENNRKLNHHVEFIGGVDEEACSMLISDYFKNKRKQKKVTLTNENI